MRKPGMSRVKFEKCGPQAPSPATFQYARNLLERSRPRLRTLGRTPPFPRLPRAEPQCHIVEDDYIAFISPLQQGKVPICVLPSQCLTYGAAAVRGVTKMRPIAEAFVKVLIAHHTQLCRPRRRTTPKTVTCADIQDCTITYGALCNAAAPDAKCAPIGSGTFWAEIHRKCRANKWPPLNALAVRKGKKKPGDNYPKGKGWIAT
jgi:hypothetical protein